MKTITNYFLGALWGACSIYTGMVVESPVGDFNTMDTITLTLYIALTVVCFITAVVVNYDSLV